LKWIKEQSVEMEYGDTLEIEVDLPNGNMSMIWKDLDKRSHKLDVRYPVDAVSIMVIDKKTYNKNNEKSKRYHKLINRLENLRWYDRLFWSIRGGLPE
jgi:hypothetical protein